MKQVTHEEFKQKQVCIKNNIVFVLENFEHNENIGSAFRLADCFNIDSIVIVSSNEIDLRKINKTARNCEKNIPFIIVKEITQAFEIIKQKGVTPICVEICDDSVPLRDVDFSSFKNGVALILGNEKYGVSQESLNLSNVAVHIDMYGNNSSINVATALAITAYKVSEDYLKVKKLKEL